jgi:hypothetical protein
LFGLFCQETTTKNPRHVLSDPESFWKCALLDCGAKLACSNGIPIKNFEQFVTKNFADGVGATVKSGCE